MRIRMRVREAENPVQIYVTYTAVQGAFKSSQHLLGPGRLLPANAINVRVIARWRRWPRAPLLLLLTPAPNCKSSLMPTVQNTCVSCVSPTWTSRAYPSVPAVNSVAHTSAHMTTAPCKKNLATTAKHTFVSCVYSMAMAMAMGVRTARGRSAQVQSIVTSIDAATHSSSARPHDRDLRIGTVAGIHVGHAVAALVWRIPLVMPATSTPCVSSFYRAVTTAAIVPCCRQ